MTQEETIKHAIFCTLVHVQGFPPADTQLGEWEAAVNEIYEEIKGQFSDDAAPQRSL